MTKRAGQSLFSHGAIVFVCLGGLVVTWAVFLTQTKIRSQVFDPTSLGIFPRLFAFEDYPATLAVAVSLVFALVPGIQRAGLHVADCLGKKPFLASLVASVVFGLGAFFIYQTHPVAMDEYAPVLQSQIFAAGSLVGHFPPPLMNWLVWPDFQGHFLSVSHSSGVIASTYWPGFALLLAPFSALGLPWLCNPIVGGASIYAVARLVRSITQSRRAVGAAILFMLGSSAFVIYSFSYYSMAAHFLCNAVFALLLTTRLRWRVLVAGLVGGLALNLHNPLPHALFAMPWVLWLVATREWRSLVYLIVGYAPGILLGIAWFWFLQDFGSGSDTLHVAEDAGILSGGLAALLSVLETPSSLLVADRVVQWAKLWIWSAPALVLVALLGWRASGYGTVQKLLLASALTTAVVFFFVRFDQGHGWGHRYFHSAWMVLPILGACLFARFDHSKPRRNRAVGRYSLALGLIGMMLVVPIQAYQVRQFILSHLEQLPTAKRGSPVVYIVNTTMGYYAQDLVQNDPFLRRGPILMASHGFAKDAEAVKRCFPDLVLIERNAKGTVWGSFDESGRESLRSRDQWLRMRRTPFFGGAPIEGTRHPDGRTQRIQC